MTLAWILFIAFILLFLIMDLRLFHKQDKAQGFKDALLWSLFWVGVSLSFNALLYVWKGAETAGYFLTAYIVEKSLSLDNLFVFLMIFKSFHVAHKYQHRVLMWGIIGALVLRALMIFLGITMIESFQFATYIFGSFLLFTGFKILSQGERKFEFRKSILARLIEKFVPVTDKIEGHHFFIKRKGVLKATPLFLALVTVEFSDVIFAVDSIPAVLAITTDRFIVFTSNIFAIMGLRSLYFLLASLIHNMRFLDMGLSYILMFIGIKMIAANHYHLPTPWSLGIILTILTVAIVASLLFPKVEKKA